eukprot:3042518-Ditylum_brightwellii.AAC.1
MHHERLLFSARLLEFTMKLTHGMFLGDGGSYTKRLYYHKLGEVNAKETCIKARPPSMDQGSTYKLINTFLNEIDDTKADPIYTEKPKHFATKESTKDITRKAIFMKDNKEQTCNKLQNKVMKVVYGLVPVTYEDVRKVYYCFKTFDIHKIGDKKPIATEGEVEAFKDEMSKIEASTMSESHTEEFLNRKKCKQAAEKNNFYPSPIAQSIL